MADRPRTHSKLHTDYWQWQHELASTTISEDWPPPTTTLHLYSRGGHPTFATCDWLKVWVWPRGDPQWPTINQSSGRIELPLTSIITNMTKNTANYTINTKTDMPWRFLTLNCVLCLTYCNSVHLSRKRCKTEILVKHKIRTNYTLTTSKKQVR